MGSIESVQVKESISSTYSVQQQQVKFHVPGDDGGASSTAKKPEDKFLKEITARIASRHVQGQNGEDGGTYGLIPDDGSNHQSKIDAKMDLLKEQRKSKDSVHKALVNELRRHLSEGEDGAEAEKVPPTLRKPVGFRKGSVPPSTADPEKSIKNGAGKKMKQLPEVAGKNSTLFRELQAEITSGRPQAGSSDVHPPISAHFTEKKVTQTHSEEFDDDAECSEMSALLTTSLDSSQQFNDKRNIAPSQQLLSSDYKISMQQSTENLPADDPEVSACQNILSFRRSEDCRDTADIHGSSLSVAKSVKSVRVVSSPHRIIDNITPAAVAATVTCAAPAAADPYALERAGSPRVAPKPQQKDRHSFPAVHSSQLTTDSSELSVEFVVRPKSEIVDKHRQDHTQDDSSA